MYVPKLLTYRFVWLSRHCPCPACALARGYEVAAFRSGNGRYWYSWLGLN